MPGEGAIATTPLTYASSGSDCAITGYEVPCSGDAGSISMIAASFVGPSASEVAGPRKWKYAIGMTGKPCRSFAPDSRSFTTGRLRLFGKPSRSGRPSAVSRRSDGKGRSQNVSPAYGPSRSHATVGALSSVQATRASRAQARRRMPLGTKRRRQALRIDSDAYLSLLAWSQNQNVSALRVSWLPEAWYASTLI